MLKIIRKILLKLNCIERAVSEHQAQQNDQRYHEHWAKIMHSGNTVREDDKPVDRPVFIDSVNWGGM